VEEEEEEEMEGKKELSLSFARPPAALELHSLLRALFGFLFHLVSIHIFLPTTAFPPLSKIIPSSAFSFLLCLLIFDDQRSHYFFFQTSLCGFLFVKRQKEFLAFLVALCHLSMNMSH